ncbi:MAG: TIGR03087 family PEP-CTERM/XrtA system glycosyltransferase [Planctomycetota bacterium]
MKLLFLSQRVPYPPNRGDKITTWRLVEWLAREHSVEVLAFAHEPADFEAARVLTEEKGIPTTAIRHDERRKKLAALPLLLTNKPLTLGVFSSRQLHAEVAKRAPEVDLAYAYSSSMGAFLEGRGIPWVMHFAELDSDKWKQYAERHKFPMSAVYRREYRTLRKFEDRIARETLSNVLCTPLEQRIFEDAIPGAPSTVIRNGVDLAYFSPERSTAEPGHIVFTGVMDYFPNVDGCVWFVREILPLVRERVPHAKFTIIGSRPTPEVNALTETPGVTVTGFVDDVRDWVARGAVSVAPLRVARGIQNKVLEALAMGLPTVGTTCATQGVEGAAGRDFLVADDAQAFASAVSELLLDADRAAALGQRGRRFVEATYDWDTCLAPLEGFVRAAAARKEQRREMQ